LALLADLFTDIKAIEARQEHIENDEVVRGCRCHQNSIAAIGKQVNSVMAALQPFFQAGTQPWIIFNYQKSHRYCYLSFHWLLKSTGWLFDTTTPQIFKQPAR